MRETLLIVLLLGGCNGGGLPIGVGGPGGGGGVNNIDGGAVDLARAPVDLASGGGTEGAPCKTACDCAAGLACRQGSCAKSQIGPVYCCESMDCPAGNFCQTAMGNFTRCGGGSGGGGGGGGGGGNQFCTFIPCNPQMDGCAQAGCGACDGTTMRCGN